MPTYEYECKNCGIMEVFQKISDPRLHSCPKCKGRIRRLIGSGTGIIFKGSGFYATDYKKKAVETKSADAACSTPKNPACQSCPKNNPAANAKTSS